MNKWQYELGDIMDDLRKIRHFFEKGYRGETEGTTFWKPEVDIYEDAEGLYFQVELPGIEQENVEISVENDNLILKGKRPKPELENKKYHRIERSYGEFQRMFNIPVNVDGEKVKASLKNGILTISLPKKEEKKPKKIQIKIEE